MIHAHVHGKVSDADTSVACLQYQTTMRYLAVMGSNFPGSSFPARGKSSLVI